MIQKVLSGNKLYWGWVLFLAALVGIGFLAFLKQNTYGLGVTGMSRDVSWALYIGQLTYLVGVAASAVMLVLPYYLHDHKAFGKITILGEFIAVSAIIMCICFVLVDVGKPDRVYNTLLHPTPGSMLFWDIVVLNIYMLLNLLIGWTVVSAEYKGAPAPKWIKPFIYLSIPWAFSIHTVTAFLYSGLAGKGFWLTAVMAPRFLGSAFAAGPALIIIFCFILKHCAGYDVGRKPINTLSKIITYAMLASIFFFVCELFTVFYSQIPEHMHHFTYMFQGLDGHTELVVPMWLCCIMAIVATLMLLVPRVRNNEFLLPIACVLVFASLWIEKGLALIVTGYIPSATEGVQGYWPTCIEMTVTAGIWALGFLLITLFYKIVLGIRKQV